LSNIWSNDAYLERFKNSASVDYAHWKEPKLIVKILLMYFQAHKHTQIHLLFQLLRAECIKFVTGFRFFRDYLDTVVCKEFSVTWKRKAFYEFVKSWKQKDSGLSTVSLNFNLCQINRKETELFLTNNKNGSDQST